jgi:hypothetical protein
MGDVPFCWFDRIQFIAISFPLFHQGHMNALEAGAASAWYLTLIGSRAISLKLL